MSATATMVYPTAPPPTKNTLNKEQRSRLLRSSRKLGSLLGTTPLVVDPDTEAETPSSRKVLTRGNVKRHITGLFQTSQSAAASSSSLSVASSSTATSSNDYVHVRPTDTRSRSRPGAAYQVQAIFDNASPPSSRSASPFPGALPRTNAGAPTPAAGDHSPTGVSRKRKQQTAGDSVGLAPPPNLIYLGPSAGSNSSINKLDKGKSTGAGAGASASATGAGHHTSQPLLLRLRAIPTDDINNRNGQLDDSSHSPPKALSPVTSTFNMNMSVDVLLPPSPSTMSVNAHTHGLSDRERRKKMAKLARTLGENIPPELVFGSSSTQNAGLEVNFGDNLPSSSTSRQPTTLTRRASASAATTLRRKNLQERDHALESFAPFHYTHDQPSTQFNATASLPPLAVAAAPQPTGRNSSDNVNHPHPHPHRQHQNHQQPPPEWERQEPQSHLRPSAQAEKLAKKRLNRPRSLTLGTASAFAAATALLSRKAEPEPEPEREPGPAPVVVPIIVAPSPPPPPAPKPRTMPMPPAEDDDTVPSRGTTSLDLDSLPSSPRTRTHTHARAQTYYDARSAMSGYGVGIGSGMDEHDLPLPSPRPFVHIVDATPFDLARSSIDSTRPTGPELAGTLTVDWGRRKEREWSGEWNLKDMEDVAKKLRGLKGR